MKLWPEIELKRWSFGGKRRGVGEIDEAKSTKLRTRWDQVKVGRRSTGTRCRRKPIIAMYTKDNICVQDVAVSSCVNIEHEACVNIVPTPTAPLVTFSNVCLFLPR